MSDHREAPSEDRDRAAELRPDGEAALVDRAVAGDRRAHGELRRVFSSGDDDRDDVIDALARAARPHTVTSETGTRPSARTGEQAAATDMLLALTTDAGLALRPIRAVLFDAADAADAHQQTLMAIFGKLHTWTGEAPFRLWLRTVARNEALTVLRKKSRTPEPRDQPEEGAAPGRFVRAMSSVIANADAVRAAVAGLPEDFRTALTLREYDQLSYADIAETLGVPEGTAKSRVNRARLMVADALRSTPL